MLPEMEFDPLRKEESAFKTMLLHLQFKIITRKI
jgi:hypothetical protein